MKMQFNLKTLTSWISTAVRGRWFSSCSFSALFGRKNSSHLKRAVHLMLTVKFY